VQKHKPNNTAEDDLEDNDFHIGAASWLLDTYPSLSGPERLSMAEIDVWTKLVRTTARRDEVSSQRSTQGPSLRGVTRKNSVRADFITFALYQTTSGVYFYLTTT
jgi:hypothetical protein